MKRLDQLLITTFVPPFIVTFAIAIFVLLMQILWLYIDDIAGKGVGFFILVELLAYKCVGLVPMALPLAILISSVMVLGGLAEQYELSSFKSAGVSLLRVMRPIILFAGVMTFVSYLCSDYIIPVANLQFGSRMYDIQQKKPALSLDPGIFNEDFANYAIHIGRKDGDGRTIRDVLIYDHNEESTGELSQIVAGEGEMFATPDGRYFIMNLRDGHQYTEARPTAGQRGGYPFVRTSFDSWTKVFDLSEFNLQRTNQALFEQNRSMMSTDQLALAVDSIQHSIDRRRVALSNHLAIYFSFMEQDTTFAGEDAWDDEMYAEGYVGRPDSAGVIVEYPTGQVDSAQVAAAGQPAPLPEPVSDSVGTDSAGQAKTILGRVKQRKPVERPPDVSSALEEAIRASKPVVADTTQAPADTVVNLIQTPPVPFPGMDSLLTLLEAREAERVYNRAQSTVRSIQSQAEAAARTIERMDENRVKHIYDLHMKYSMAVVCMIFVFIGAPMGAIVRKGGFGYPILVSIIFFMLFVILTILCRKLAETFVLPPTLAGWMPCIILLPLGLFLTHKAMNDSKLFSVERYTNFLSRLFQRKEQVNAKTS